MSITVVIHKGTAGGPARFFIQQSSFLRDVSEGAVAVVVVERILAVIGDEQVFEAVIVVVAYANSLSPPRALQTGFLRNVGKSAIAIVLEQIARRLLAFGKALEACAVDQEDIEPAIVVIIVEGDAGAGSF